jgi:hypothetical protein
VVLSLPFSSQAASKVKTKTLPRIHAQERRPELRANLLHPISSETEKFPVQQESTFELLI